jgi:hypothetical protein
MTVRDARPPRLWPWGAALLLAGVLPLPIAAARAAAPAKASTQRNVAPARALVAALDHYYAAGLATRREANANVSAFVGDVHKRCPNVLPDTLLDGGSRQRTVYKQLFTEGAIDIGLVALQAVGDATATEAEALDRIHFSKPSVNRDLRQLARSQRATLTLAPEDLCDDIRLAADDGFKRVPLTTTRFVARVQNVLARPAPSFDDLVSDALPSLHTSRDAAAVRHLRALGGRYTNFVVNVGIQAGTRLAHALGASR